MRSPATRASPTATVTSPTAARWRSRPTRSTAASVGRAAPSTPAACESSACVGTSCDPGYADCDGDRANGCETLVDANPSHCGRCGRACAFANATPVCRAGLCALGTCAAGFGDCDGDPTNGCELPLNTLANCGACRAACLSARNATALCNAGVCEQRCVAAAGDCDRDLANGCETLLGSNLSNCGACGRMCTAMAPHTAPTCTGVVCGTACILPYADCDGDPSNGCEVNVQADANNCSRCGAACVLPRVEAACSPLRCVIARCLNAGRADCDGEPLSGCERDLRTDRRAAAPAGARALRSPRRTWSRPVATGPAAPAASSGYADCDGNALNGCELDGRSDRGRCGACDRVCPAGTDCVSGECAPPPPRRCSRR